jgi:hypothetical protein
VLQDEFNEELPDHHYRTEIPNCVLDACLDVYQLSVYIYIKRIAGDKGKCWQKKKTLAEVMGISERQVTYALDALCSSENNFKYPLLRKTARIKPDGSQDSNLYTVINIWAYNGNLYRAKNGGGGAPDAPGVVQEVQGGGAPGAYKEEPSQEEPLEEELLSDAVVVPHLKTFEKLSLSESCRKKIISEYSAEDIELASQRCLDWKGRSNDEAGIFTALKNKNSWNDVKSEEDLEKDKKEKVNKTIEENIKWAEEYIKKMQEQFPESKNLIKICDSRIEIKIKNNWACIAFVENEFKLALKSSIKIAIENRKS